MAYQNIKHTQAVANTDETIATVGASKAFIVSNITICNPLIVSATYTLTVWTKVFVSDDDILPSESIFNTNGFVFITWDVLKVKASVVGIEFLVSYKEVDN